MDPIVFHLVWLSSIIAFCIELTLSNPSFWTFFILLNSVIYNFCLFLFSKDIKATSSSAQQSTIKVEVPNRYYLIIILLFFIQFILINYKKWAFIIDHGVLEASVYKFLVLAEGRSIFETILQITFEPVLNYIIFYSLIFEKNKTKKGVAWLILLHNICLLVLTGGRSTIITTAIAFGTFAFYFRKDINFKAFSKKTNLLTMLIIPIGILLAVIVSSLYGTHLHNEGFSVYKGFDIIVNRIFANADGVEYFIKYKGEKYIEPLGFIFYNFGPFINQLFNLEIKNFGWLLIESAYGSNVGFAQGPNFIIMLQALMFFHPFLAPIYIFTTSFLVLKLRYFKFKSLSATDIYFYFLSSIAISFFVDSEYFFFRLIIFSISFLFIFMPIFGILFKLRFKSKNITNQQSIASQSAI